MEAAKESVKKFVSKSGHHDTTLHEKVAPTVQRETVSQTQHEKQTTAVDREVHQDHYHTTEQPVSHSEVLPEQHHHKAVPVEHRSFEHDDADELNRGLDNERKQYYDTQTRVEGEKTRSENPVVQGEHVHHHVHETIQPVVNKQTIEPHVIHTTVPIHEVHHNKAQHHAASELPPITMEDFKTQGGVLNGQKEKTTFFPEGQPRSLRGRQVGEYGEMQDSVLGSNGVKGTDQSAETEQIRNDSVTSAGNGAFLRNEGMQSDSGKQINADKSIASQTTNNGSYNTSYKKPGLMDRLNPKTDADGNGKAGILN